MKLVSFEITNYRSIKKSGRIRLEGGACVLIGPNNEGKSNIARGLVLALESLRLVRANDFSNTRLRPSIYEWERDFPLDKQASHPAGESKFLLELELEGSEIADFVRETGSKLNGRLPLLVVWGNKSRPSVVIHKKGRGQKTLSGKADRIAKFVGGRFDIQHIPALRSANDALRVINSMLAESFRAVESTAEFQEAITQIRRLQDPILRRLGDGLHQALRGFLPDILQVRIEVDDRERLRALRGGDYNIWIDDGASTPLSHKGDGVQSLAVIALLQDAFLKRSEGRELVLVIEEPESHLHPRAVREVARILQDLMQHRQIIVTTHSPLMANRQRAGANVIVENQSARSAMSISEVRETLGVAASDNLESAEVVLLVEGETDARALGSILVYQRPEIEEAIKTHRLRLEPIRGTRNLAPRASQLADSVCSVHCVVDSDETAHEHVNEAISQGILQAHDVTVLSFQGMRESELEDAVAHDILEAVLNATDQRIWPEMKMAKDKRAKFSTRLKAACKAAGVPLTDDTVPKIKQDIAECVAGQPEGSLLATRLGVFDGIASTLRKLLGIEPGASIP